MTTEDFKRKLTAILSADVVGYSRLMGDDESATVKTLEIYKGVMSSLIKQHRGRVVDSPGDNLLAEFGSVVDAVQCAVSIQKELQARNKELPENRRMDFRIGINLGDVIEEEDRLYGDGVNIAARLEALADPGGICVSKTAFDHIESKLPLGYEFMGEQTVKNIAKPVGAYKVLMETRVIDAKAKREAKTVSFRRRKSVLSLGIIVILVIVAGFYWNFYTSETSLEPDQETVVTEIKESPKTIAVLPFKNISSDSEQEYFADGLTEELINKLAQIKDLQVTGRTSSFYFKNKDINLRTIGETLEVAYLLEGSVRKSGDKLRITAQLIKADDGYHLFSKDYERREMKDIFNIQDDIAKSVADALQITLGVGELGRTKGMTRNIDAYVALLAGRSSLSKFKLERAIDQFQQAVDLDQDFAIAWYNLALAYFLAVNPFPERAEEFSAKSRAAASRVIELIPDSDIALRLAARESGDKVELEQVLKKVISLDSSDYDTNIEYASFLRDAGRVTEAIDYYKRLLWLEPLKSVGYFALGMAYDLSGNLDAAIKSLKKSRDLTDKPVTQNSILLIFALEENNRALIDEYLALVENEEAFGDVADTRRFIKVVRELLDKPGEAAAKLKLLLADPAYNNTSARSMISVLASYFGEPEIALQRYSEDKTNSFEFWLPIHKEMRRLPGFKNLVREMGLADYWRKSDNWGDYCHPVGDDDFECN